MLLSNLCGKFRPGYESRTHGNPMETVHHNTRGVASGICMRAHRSYPATICHYGNTAILVFLAFYFLLIPFGMAIYYLFDPALKGEGIPRIAFALHRSLSPKYEKWARKRVSSGGAKGLSVENIAGTEWPVFGSAFYLWATESLQQAWEKDKSLSAIAPNVYAAGAIDAAAALVADPGHASWVRQHWGEEYLHRENVFYRMLLIGALTSQHRLLGTQEHLRVLQDQVETLSKALDDSPHGILDDYPEQCYPADVIAAVAVIRRADVVLGTDHSGFVRRSIRAFQGDLLDSRGLPPYEADSRNGVIGSARGCSNSWALIWAPELWPEQAKKWYDAHERHFWRQRLSAAGFREFPKDVPGRQWYIDVDSGPVAAGYGVAACAFGIGAARANGRFDHAYPLSAEAIVMSGLLPDGTLFGGRMLSNMAHAPYVGEAGLLFALTRMPAEGIEITNGVRLPVFAYGVLTLYLGAFVVVILAATLAFNRWRVQVSKEPIPFGKVQLIIWSILIAGGMVVGIAHRLPLGLLLILLAQFLPRGEKMVVRERSHDGQQKDRARNRERR